MRDCFTSIIVLTSVFTSSVAGAQEEPPKKTGAFNPDTFSILSRLRDEDIQKLIKITKEQKESLFKIQNNWLKEFKNYSELPIAKRDREDLSSALRTYENQAAETLGPDKTKQVYRLTTLTYFGIPFLQYFREPPNRNDLSLNMKQIELVENLYRQWLSDGLDLLSQPEFRDKNRTQLFEPLLALNKKWENKIRNEVGKTLSTDQKRRLSELEFQSECITLQVRVFATSSLQKELSLTPTQRRTVDKIIADLPDDFGKQFSALNRGYEKCVQMLDDKQLAIFKKKLGKLSKRNASLLPKKT